jgi:hypothetical protein
MIGWMVWLLGCGAAKDTSFPEITETETDTETTTETDTDTEPAPAVDLDGDGASPPEDCDDADPGVYPGAIEVCDGADQDCDALVDDADPSLDLGSASVWFADVDEDGFGDAAVSVAACVAPAGHVANDGDCDDADPARAPDHPEICGGVDEDCDGLVDDDDPSVSDATAWYPDGDGDGAGADEGVVVACVAPAGSVPSSGDCDDAAPEVGPSALEVCNTIDDDCDGSIDDADPSRDPASATVWYPDVDGDGFGDPSAPLAACVAPAGYGVDDQDCDDAHAAAFPGGEELPDDGVDGDCDGVDVRSVPLDDAALRWVGRVDVTDPSSRAMHWPGSGFVTVVDGERLWIEVEDDSGSNRLVVYVDGALVHTAALVAGAQWVEVAGLGPGPHTVAVSKRTETFEGDITVRRLWVDATATVVPAPDPAVRFEFYGDSITAGYSVLCACNLGDAEYKAHDLTYAARATRAFGGEHTAIALSGVGIVRSWWALDMFDYWDAVRDADGAWDFGRYEADVVVVNLGQNDYWLGVRDNITPAYAEFGRLLRAAHPSAEIFFALGSMDAVAPGSPMPGRLEAAVDLLVAEGDPAVHLVLFDYNGDGTHPVDAVQQDMADALVAAIAAARPDLVAP